MTGNRIASLCEELADNPAYYKYQRRVSFRMPPWWAETVLMFELFAGTLAWFVLAFFCNSNPERHLAITSSFQTGYRKYLI